VSLVDIIEKNNLDIATDKNTLHNYVKGFYEKYFEPYKDAEVNLVEIGVWMGGSVKLWSEYFSNARSIIGIELNQESIWDQYKEVENSTYYFGDAYSREICDRISDIDIFIDDGPHTLDSMIEAIKLYLPKVNPGGIFVIEDIQDFTWFDDLESTAATVIKELDTCSYVLEKIDLREMVNVYGETRYDDLMFVIKVK